MLQKNKKIRSFNPYRFLVIYGDSLGDHFIGKSEEVEHNPNMKWLLYKLGNKFKRFKNGELTEIVRLELTARIEKVMRIKFKELPLHINNHKLFQSVLIEWRLKNGI